MEGEKITGTEIELNDVKVGDFVYFIAAAWAGKCVHKSDFKAEKNANEVRNRRAYLITLLHNAPTIVGNSPAKNADESCEMPSSSITSEMIQKRIWAQYENS